MKRNCLTGLNNRAILTIWLKSLIIILIITVMNNQNKKNIDS